MNQPLIAIPPVTFEIPRPPSKKNGQRVLFASGPYCRFCKRSSGKPFVKSGVEAEKHELSLIDFLRDHFTYGESHFGDHDVRVVMHHHVLRDVVEITVEDMGPRAKGRTGRICDAHNLFDLPMDAMQKLVFDNDNQVVDARVRRTLT